MICKYSRSNVTKFIKQEKYDESVLQKIKENFNDYEVSYPNIIGNNKKYRKFILLSKPRSGSTLILSLLRTHPDIVCLEELFRDNECHFEFPFFPAANNLELLHLRNKNPVKFLNAFVFRKYMSNFSSVGFKIFYQLEQNKEFPSVWKYLEKNKDIHVIHLIRKNHFHAFVSLKMAEMTNTWTHIDPLVIDKIQRSGLNEFLPFNFNDHKAKNKLTTLTLDPGETENYFIESEKNHEDFSGKFSSHPYLNVFYEDLIHDQNIEIKKILSFIGAQDRPLICPLLRQNKRKIIDMVSNYSQLKIKFQQTRWAEFFDT